LASALAALGAGWLCAGGSALAAYGDLQEPAALASRNGLLDILMIAAPGPVDFAGANLRTTGWYYTVCRRPADGDACPDDGATISSYGGFRLALQPGDELKIRLVNHLPALPPASLEFVHYDPLLALNPTNLHTHGLIVPAAANSKAPPAIPQYGDFILTALFNYNHGDPALNPAQYDETAYQTLHAHTDVVYNSASAADYDIRLPANHPSGAFWIHPHVHGTVGAQVTMGLSGIISVGNAAAYACWDEACNDPIPESSVRHLILKDMQVLAGRVPLYQQDPTFCQEQTGDLPQTATGPGVCQGNAQTYAGGHWLFTLNGQQYPRIAVKGPKGEIWRLTNASANATYDLALSDKSTGADMPLQLISVDGVAVSFPEGSSASQIQATLGARFDPADCGPTATPYATKPVCVKHIVMMPGTRVEVAAAWRDKTGRLAAPPAGAAGVFYTRGIVTGPGGDPWPKVGLGEVDFDYGAASAASEPVHVKPTGVFGAAGIFAAPVAASARVATANCQPLPRGHHRRIYFANPNVPDEAEGPGTDADGDAIFGIGYEEIDQFGQSVPGTFHDVAQFDPANLICIPLGPGQTPRLETWELVNLATELHNFHIHQTKFARVTPEVAQSGPPTLATIANGILEDSAPLPYALPGPGSQPALAPEATSCLVADYKAGRCAATSVWVQIPFTQLGTFVFHCHILEHEDGGMMHAVRVVAAPS
jgi:FtsP/CotA-like multicopper oxidase with cupredoxin domain